MKTKLQFIFTIFILTVFFTYGNVLGATYNLLLEATTDGDTISTSFSRGDDLYLNIILDNADGVAGVAFTLTYDATRLTGPATDADGLPVNPGDVTSLFPFTYSSTKTHRVNSTEPNMIYLAGAEIDPIHGGSKYGGGEITLFTIKFQVKSDATIGTHTFNLEQTLLYNQDAGYGTDHTVPIFVGALPNSDPNFGGDLSDDFPDLTTGLGALPSLEINIPPENQINDFNGDGTHDVLVRHSSGSWYIYLMNANGTTVKQGAYMPFTSNLDWQFADITDFDGDGIPDVLVRHSSGSWYIYLMNANGTTVKQGAYMPFTGDLAWQLADITDFDGDGTPDVLVRHSSGSWYIYLMNANGTTVKQGVYMPFASDLSWQLADVTDFDGDGTPDVLVRHSSGSWYIYLMNANGTTVKQGAWMPFTSDLAWQLADVTDFDGDGTPDVLVRHSSGSWYIYLMNANGTTIKQGAWMPFTSDLSWQLAEVTDFDGDGTPDVLVRHTNGAWYIYMMNADGITVKQGAYMPFTKDTEWQQTN